MPSVSSWVSIGFRPCETSLNFAKIDLFMPKFVDFFRIWLDLDEILANLEEIRLNLNILDKTDRPTTPIGREQQVSGV